MSALLELESLSVAYEGLLALDGVTFTVPERSIVGLIGPNGAGKTTCIDAICGFTPSSGGRVTFSGHALDGTPPHRRARSGLVRTFQSVELFENLTVRENMLVAASRSRWWSPLVHAVAPRHGTADVSWALDAAGLHGDADRLPHELSYGKRRLAGLARALASHPRLVLLDEPAAGLDTTETAVLGERLRALPDLGVSALLVDHDMGLILGTCETVHVLDFGCLIASGTPAEIRSDPAVLRAYLGEPGTDSGRDR